jgi:hypothetical protein
MTILSPFVAFAMVYELGYYGKAELMNEQMAVIGILLLTSWACIALRFQKKARSSIRVALLISCFLCIYYYSIREGWVNGGTAKRFFLPGPISILGAAVSELPVFVRMFNWIQVAAVVTYFVACSIPYLQFAFEPR